MACAPAWWPRRLIAGSPATRTPPRPRSSTTAPRCLPGNRCARRRAPADRRSAAAVRAGAAVSRTRRGLSRLRPRFLSGRGRLEDGRAAANARCRSPKQPAPAPRSPAACAESGRSTRSGSRRCLRGVRQVFTSSRALAQAAGDARTLLGVAIDESNACCSWGSFSSAEDAALQRPAGRPPDRPGSLVWCHVLAGNAAEAMLAGGRTAEAAALIDPLTTGPPTPRPLGCTSAPGPHRPAARRPGGRHRAAPADQGTDQPALPRRVCLRNGAAGGGAGAVGGAARRRP